MSRQSANGRVASAPADWAGSGYQPAGSTRLLACDRRGCGAKYLDDGPGRQAHIAVFGHSPKAAEPAEPPEEARPEG